MNTTADVQPGPDPAHGAVVDAPTERRSPDTLDIDQVDSLALLHRINAQDATVAAAVAAALPQVALAVDLGVAALRDGHRVHYFGAGSSGRIAVLDAAELAPTFALEPGRVVAHLAGGPSAFARPVENAEDDEAGGERDAATVGPGDLTVALTASGRTPYAGGALRAARRAGAGTVLVSANPAAPLADRADIHICVDTGPEAITGSTRMKAGTAQKLVLNAFSTAVMVRLGRTYSNLMVDVVATNAKLRGRLVEMLRQATGADRHRCLAALSDAGGEAKVALVCLLAHVPPARARAALDTAGGVVRAALDALGRTQHLPDPHPAAAPGMPPGRGSRHGTGRGHER